MNQPSNHATALSASALELRKFSPCDQARNSLHFLTQMTDPKLEYLPYGVVQPYLELPFAEHTRMDDAQLIASWYEALSQTREILQTEEGKDVEEGLLKLLLDPDCWDKASGFRFPAQRSWTGEIAYCTLSEQGVVLSALTRLLTVHPEHKTAAKYAEKLISGLRKQTLSHTVRLTPQGAFSIPEKFLPIYSFPADVFVRGKGPAPELSTGFADAGMRTAALLHPILEYYSLTKNKDALDLALGIGHYCASFSHFFSHKTEFCGDVCSALRTAAGLARLGRIFSRDRFVARAKALYDNLRRQTSHYGWVPMHLQWQEVENESCDPSSVAALIICALELIECGFPEYWSDVFRFWRNQLAHAQIQLTHWVPDPAGETPADTERTTFNRIGERIRGAYCGNLSPRFIHLNRPRLISASASALCATAFYRAWTHSLEQNQRVISIQMPVDRETPFIRVRTEYPYKGEVTITLKEECRLNLRIYPWMPSPHEGSIKGRPAAVEHRDDFLCFPKCPAGTVLRFRHELKTIRVQETVAALSLFGIWRGPDLISLLPFATGCGYPVYHEPDKIAATHFPKPPKLSEEEREALLAPYLEPPIPRDVRLNRRKSPRT